jgi:25S rRNA (uracil2843-N3)-methyltransferase
MELDKEGKKFLELQLEKLTPHPDQILLNIIQQLQTNQGDQFDSKLRKIKDLFLQREFISIFTNAELLPVYAIEYLPGRSLCYRDVFLKLKPIRKIIQNGGIIYSLGSGNGAELMAIASVMSKGVGKVHMNILDISDYQIIPSLITQLDLKFGLSDRLSYAIKLGDLLDNLGFLSDLTGANVVTACFILNEIMSQSKASFAKLLTSLVPAIQSGAYFLVIDSAGSFSEFKLAEKDDSFMLFKLLDQIKAFRVIEAYDSIWYRYNTELVYPSKISNMRFFLRLYQKK